MTYLYMTEMTDTTDKTDRHDRHDRHKQCDRLNRHDIHNLHKSKKKKLHVTFLKGKVSQDFYPVFSNDSSHLGNIIPNNITPNAT